jgi:hypothetical protein
MSFLEIAKLLVETVALPSESRAHRQTFCDIRTGGVTSLGQNIGTWTRAYTLSERKLRVFSEHLQVMRGDQTGIRIATKRLILLFVREWGTPITGGWFRSLPVTRIGTR